MDPDTQDQNSNTSPGTDTTQNQIPQERLDQVIGQLRGMERTNAQQQELMAQQAATIANLTATKAPAIAAPEIAEEDAVKIAYIVEKATAPIRAQMQQMSAMLSQTRVEPRMEAARAQLAKINNPAIQNRYDQLIDMWKKDGRLQSGSAAPADALKIAAGEFALGQLEEVGNSAQQRREFNGGFQPLNNAGGRGGAQKAKTTVIEKDMTEMSVEELTKSLEADQQSNPDGHGL